MSETEERKQVIMEFLQRPLLSVYDYAVDEIVRLRAENAALTAAVWRVRALHKPPPNTFESVWFGNDGQVLLLVCNECGENLPCPTLRALERTP